MSQPLYLYNTASRAKELFAPQHDVVGMYCCGPTVYNYAHIGNLRTYIFEDVLKRALLSQGYSVRHVLNITDVGHLVSDADTGEDKMEKGAQREGKSVWVLASFYTQKFMENLADLNILKADLCPKATDHISQMIAMVRELEAKGFTYRTNDGIYFDTTRFPAYADFARLDPESIRPGERVKMGAKRSPTDFALWKSSPKNAKRQMEWKSPWGVGFPGWHIECSAMSLAYLPQPIDIHAGGSDHIRIHHTNEIAQSEAATGRKFVRYWLHGEFLVIDRGKMAKSGGNFITLNTLKADGIPPLAYRLFCFSAHYRSPLTYSPEGIKSAKTSYLNLRRSLAGKPDPGTAPWQGSDNGRDDRPEAVTSLLEGFYRAVYDDLNMPKAMAALWDIVRDEKIPHGLQRAAARKADEILGLDLLAGLSEQPVEEFTGATGSIRLLSAGTLTDVRKSEIIKMVGERQKVRREKNWAAADILRKELVKLGAIVKDLPDGSAEVNF
jgi:cysteinyl-tRNA synthetase